MSISKSDYQLLVSKVGQEYADHLVQAADAQDKAIEGAGVSFKSLPNLPPVKVPIADKGENPFGGDEDEDDEDEEMKSFSPTEIVMVSGLKQLTEHFVANLKELDETRKQVKDLSNQVDINNGSIGEVKDSLRRIEQHFKQLVNRQPASRSDKTMYDGGDPLVDTVITENHAEKSQPEPILNQISKQVSIPSVPTE